MGEMEIHTDDTDFADNADVFYLRAVPCSLTAEDEIDGKDEQHGSHYVVPAQLHLKSNNGEEDEDGEGDNLLNNLELHEVERTAIACKTNTIGRHLKAILEESHTPTQHYDSYQR